MILSFSIKKIKYGVKIMTKEKMNVLYNISIKIVNIMITLGMTNYNGYSLKFTSQGTFLMLRDVYISLTLKNDYIGENLNNFMPATTSEVMEQFNSDLNNNFFETLENVYNEYIK